MNKTEKFTNVLFVLTVITFVVTVAAYWNTK